MKTLFDTIKNLPADPETVQYVEDCKENASKSLSGDALSAYLDGLLSALGLEIR